MYRLDIPPFLSYAAAYCLFNYTLDRPEEGLKYSNLRLVRAFERGLDHKSSEAGFVLTHVDMVKESPALVSGAVKVLDTIEKGGPRSEVNDGFREILKAMEKIEACMEGTIHYPPTVYTEVNISANLTFLMKTCGATQSLPITCPSACSSSALLPSPCSQMASYTKASTTTNRCSSVGRAVQMTAWYASPFPFPSFNSSSATSSLNIHTEYRYHFWTISSRSPCPTLH